MLPLKSRAGVRASALASPACRRLRTLQWLAATLGAFASVCIAAAASAQPQRFHPEALAQDGRISLTPALTRDGQRLYFPQSECADIGRCPQRLKVSTLEDGAWTRPRLLPLGSDARVDWPSLSLDDTQLLFSWAPARGDAGIDIDFDLYRLDLQRADARPQRIEGPDLNRVRGGAVQRLRFVHNETQPMLAANGDLYFWSERLDGAGGRDVYRAAADGTGGYRPPQLLPAPINTRFDDSVGWIADDARSLLLSSTRPGGLGESDLYVARCVDGAWSEPLSLGDAVNSPWNDFGPRLTPDGTTLLFSSTRPFDERAPGLIQIWAVAVEAVPALADLRVGEPAAAHEQSNGSTPASCDVG